MEGLARSSNDITPQDLSKLQAVLLLIMLLLIGLRLFDEHFIGRRSYGGRDFGSGSGSPPPSDGATDKKAKKTNKAHVDKRSRARTFSRFVNGLSLGVDMSPPLFTPRSSDYSELPQEDSEHEKARYRHGGFSGDEDSHDDVGSPRKKRRHQL